MLLLLAGLTALTIVIFYAEENARGAQEWNVAKQDLLNAGESIDYCDYIPLAIPENQNLAAIPLFKTGLDPDNGGNREILELKKALSNINPSSLPKTGNWMKGETTDMVPIQKYLSDRYQKTFGRTNPGLGVMEEIDALCPALNDLRQAAVTRPRARFDQDYTTQPPYDRPLGPITQQIGLAKILNLHAIAALSENKPDVALNDIGIALRLSEGVREEPLLVSGLVAIGMDSIQLTAIWEGLNRHAWSSQQLDELQKQLRGIDFISSYQLCVRGEAAGFFVPTNDWMKDHRMSAAKLLFGPTWGLITNGDTGSYEPDAKPSIFARLISWLVPRGWFDMCNARAVVLYFRAARELADPGKHRIDTEKADQFEQRIQSLSRYDLPDILLRVSAGPVIYSVKQYAKGQFRTDTASIACALERYRLVHRAFPDSLHELDSSDAAGLPADPINGEPYHYKLNTDGRYLLYSVGWNRTDDRGTTVYMAGSSTAIDWDHGDWVAPSPGAR